MNAWSISDKSCDKQVSATICLGSCAGRTVAGYQPCGLLPLGPGSPTLLAYCFFLRSLIAPGSEGGDSTYFQPSMQAQGMLHRELVGVNYLRVVAVSPTWLF